MDKTSLFPNPATDVIYIEGIQFQNENPVVYKIMNTTGQVVKQETVSTNGIPVSELLSGLYFIKIHGFKAVAFLKK